MTEAYSLREYAASRTVHREIRDVLSEMHDDGWTAKPRNKRGFWVVPPNDLSSPYYVPITVKDVTAVAKDLRKALVQWRDKVVQDGILQAVAHQVRQENAETGPRQVPWCGLHQQAFATWDHLSEHVRTAHDSTDPEEVLEPTPEPEPEPVEQAEEPVSSGDKTCTIDEGDGSPPVTEKVDKNTSRKGNPHARHNDWQQVRGQLARDIYEAMRGRSQANMALSTYANALAMDIEAKRLAEGRTGFDDGTTLLGLVQSLVNQVENDPTTAAELESALRSNEDLSRELAAVNAKYEALKAKWDAFMSLAKEE